MLDDGRYVNYRMVYGYKAIPVSSGNIGEMEMSLTIFRDIVIQEIPGITEIETVCLVIPDEVRTFVLLKTRNTS